MRAFCPPHHTRDALLNYTSMPTPQQQEALFKEGRINLAI